MQRTLDECRLLHNHLREQRKVAYEEHGGTLTLYGQQDTLPNFKVERPSLRAVHSQVLQNVAVRLDLAFKAFFRRVKAGKELSERVHRCSCCGLVMDRDHNAALNIMAVGLHSLAHA
jgi:transposase